MNPIQDSTQTAGQKKSSRLQSSGRSTLIFSDDTERIGKIKTLLSPYCDTLQSAPSAAIFRPKPVQSTYSLIVVTGIDTNTSLSAFFKQLKVHYPDARTIFIIDAINSEAEIEARTTGTLFIGSIDAFQKNGIQIIQSAWKKQSDTAATGPVHSPQPSASSLDVVLVDDDRRVLGSIIRTLDGAPYSIHAFDSAEKAVDAIGQLKPAVVIADYRMPEMNGIELLEKVKQKWPTIIRLMMTGQAEIETILAAINRCQVYKFISKPWNPDSLRIDIAEAIAFSQFMQGMDTDNYFSGYLRQQHMERMAGVRELATAVCHEMGQPLQIISGWTELLLMDLPAKDKMLQNQLTMIRKEIHRMGGILENLRQLQSYRTLPYPGGATMIDISSASGLQPAK